MKKSSRPRVTGLGGIFFKARDSSALGTWYRDHLGLPVQAWGGCSFEWRDVKKPDQKGATIWSVFDGDTKYFKPSRKAFMINFRVDDLDRVLAELRAEGVTVMPEIEESEFGKFGWVMDPEGNKVELWQPPAPRKPRKRKAKQ